MTETNHKRHIDPATVASTSHPATYLATSGNRYSIDDSTAKLASIGMRIRKSVAEGYKRSQSTLGTSEYPPRFAASEAETLSPEEQRFRDLVMSATVNFPAPVAPVAPAGSAAARRVPLPPHLRENGAPPNMDALMRSSYAHYSASDSSVLSSWASGATLGGPAVSNEGREKRKRELNDVETLEEADEDEEGEKFFSSQHSASGFDEFEEPSFLKPKEQL